tara:strand:+ start:54 stop:521 length:468 start_codon:yes stop_codon:yes gene_type:complete
MKPPNNIKSQSLGLLVYDYEDSSDRDILGLKKEIDHPAGKVAICFPDLDHERSFNDWIALIAKFDTTFEFLLPRIEEVKSEALDRVIKLHDEYFPDDADLPRKNEIWSSLKLESLNYYDDGAIGLWFPGKEYFHWLDLNIELNTEWLIEEVRLDG